MLDRAKVLFQNIKSHLKEESAVMHVVPSIGTLVVSIHSHPFYFTFLSLSLSLSLSLALCIVLFLAPFAQ